MLTEMQERLIILLPETDVGQAQMIWINEEIEQLESKDILAKICDDPLIEDFRVQMGIKIGLRMVRDKAQELKSQLQNKGV